ncbi:MAG: patatin, partial [Thiohalomonadales bacterium]
MTIFKNKKQLINLLLLFLFIISSGCVTRPPALPQEYARELPWGALDLDINKQGPFTLRDSIGSILIKKANAYSNSEGTVPFNILTLSGGGTRGAYGAGLLYGWNNRGDIPKFDIVT